MVTPARTILHIPHASRVIPRHLAGGYLLSPKELEGELLVMTDMYTDELFETGRGDVASVVFPVSRLIVDPERFPHDADEPMAASGMGAVYTRGHDGREIRRLEPEAREELMREYYWAHHRKLSEAVAAAVSAHGQCLIVDGHSFPSVPLPYEDDQAPERPEVCLGADSYHTPPSLLGAARDVAAQYGWTVEVNRPFSGAIVPADRYGRDRRVASIMIEIRRDLYMDERSGRKSPLFDAVQGGVRAMVRALISEMWEEEP